MSLCRLDANCFRNFSHLKLLPSPKFNIIVGPNGSGKTSLLEAIHFLSLGRSFRSRQIQKIIQVDQQLLTLFGLIKDNSGLTTPIGIEKSRNGDSKIRIDQKNIAQLAQLAEYLPLLIINPDSYRLLDAGPKYRRQFLDWGLFHVEHRFYPLWQRLSRILSQRNGALKLCQRNEDIQLWDADFCVTSEAIESMRQDYLEQLTPIFTELLQQMITLKGLSLKYKKGWAKDGLLKDVLIKSLFRDKALGFTQYGPHRSDLIVSVNGLPAQDVLSRGQQKCVVYALRLAQGIILQRQAQKSCLYLIDDLASELDGTICRTVAKVLHSMQQQVFITGVSSQGLEVFLDNDDDCRLFHVEHGKIREAVTGIQKSEV